VGASNLLEPSGPVNACNGIALPYIEEIIIVRSNFTYFPNETSNYTG
jgi:hypothetical protein